MSQESATAAAAAASARPRPPSPPHTCADRPASRDCSLRLLSAVWPDANARAIPTAQGLGLIPQLLWVARFSPDRHFTPRTPRLTPSRPSPRTSPREHTWRLVHNPWLSQSAASISCRSQSDAHREPPDAESYGPCLLGAWPWQRGCPMSLRTFTDPQTLPRSHSSIGLP